MNDRGVSYTFGPDVTTKFCEKHDLDLICRAHQVRLVAVALPGNANSPRGSDGVGRKGTRTRWMRMHRWLKTGTSSRRADI